MPDNGFLLVFYRYSSSKFHRLKVNCAFYYCKKRLRENAARWRRMAKVALAVDRPTTVSQKRTVPSPRLSLNVDEARGLLLL